MKRENKKLEKAEFARLVASGVEPPDAYRQAFKKPNVMEKTAKRQALRILSESSIVRARIKQISDAADLNAVMCREERMTLLSSKIKQLNESGDIKNMVACIAELNKMDGAYMPAKVEVKSDIVADFVRAQIEKAASEPLVRS